MTAEPFTSRAGSLASLALSNSTLSNNSTTAGNGGAIG